MAPPALAGGVWGLHALLSLALLAHGLLYLRMALRRARLPAPRDPAPPAGPGAAAVPTVTVQVAVRNEGPLVAEALAAVAALDWPRDRLEVQLLDDSDEEQAEANAATVAALRAGGLDVAQLRRGTRAGFKAGALQHGLDRARGEVVVPLDADFLPPRDLLRRLVPHLADPGVACAQTRWSCRNGAQNPLTKAQELAMDAHFVVEQRTRAAEGSLMSFNATACAWRRAAVASLGGWPQATLAEDLDLATRAHLAGWRFAYLEATEVPALLPARRSAFSDQQARWARGSMQNARLHSAAVLRSGLPLRVRLSTLHHLWHYSIHSLILGLVATQAALVLLADVPAWYAWGLPTATAAGPVAMYAVAEAKIGGARRLGRVARLVPLSVVGLGVTARLGAAALLGAASRRTGSFVRTRKADARFRVEWPALAAAAAVAGWAAVAWPWGADPLAPGVLAFGACCLATALWP